MAAELTSQMQNSDTTAPSGEELYHLQFLLQVASPETVGYTLIYQICLRQWKVPNITVM